MKITNFVLVNMTSTLQGYSDKKLPQKIGYAITRNLMTVSKEYQAYDTQLKKIFEAYSEHIVKDKDGNVQTNPNGIPVVDAPVRGEFNEQITELLNIEIEVELYHIDQNVFDYDDDKGIYDAMTAQDIMLLLSILCEPESDK